MKKLILFALFASSTAFAHGFIAGTLVKTPKGFTPIEQVRVEDLVMSCENSRCVEAKVIQTFENRVSSYLEMDLGDDVIVGLSENHRFFVPSQNSWFLAKHIGERVDLRNADFETVNVKSVGAVDQELLLYDLSVEGSHNFYVSKKAVLVHNMKNINGFTWLFGKIFGLQTNLFDRTEMNVLVISGFMGLMGLVARETDYLSRKVGNHLIFWGALVASVVALKRQLI